VSAAVVFGSLAAVVASAVALLTLGETAAILSFLTVIGLTALTAAVGDSGWVRWFTRGAVAVLVAGTALVAWQASLIVHALTGSDGPTADPDPAALASAHARLQDLGAAGTFRLELTEAEVEALIQDELDDASPLARVRVRIIDGVNGGDGAMHLTGEFRRGTVEARAVATALARSGRVEIRIDSLEVGIFSLPGVASGAADDLAESLAGLNATLASAGGHVDSVHLGGGRLVVVGTRVGRIEQQP
jgi:hypothetical protein